MDKKKNEVSAEKIAEALIPRLRNAAAELAALALDLEQLIGGGVVAAGDGNNDPPPGGGG